MCPKAKHMIRNTHFSAQRTLLPNFSCGYKWVNISDNNLDMMYYLTFVVSKVLLLKAVKLMPVNVFFNKDGSH